MRAQEHGANKKQSHLRDVLNGKTQTAESQQKFLITWLSEYTVSKSIKSDIMVHGSASTLPKDVVLLMAALSPESQERALKSATRVTF